MGLEDLTGNKYINALNSSNPVGGSDRVKSLDNQIRGFKNVVLKTLPNISGPVNPNQDEFNVLVGIDTTLSANEINTTFTKVGRFEIDSSGNIYDYGAKIVGITTDTTLDSTHNGKILEVDNASDVTITLPLNASATDMNKGYAVTLTQIATGAVIVTGQDSTVTVNAVSTIASYQTKEQWSVVGIYKRASDEWTMYGDAE